jgi:molybdopterin-guanine dinucleotide biosynthesis protein A
VTWAAVILTGGRAQRLGGADKAALEHRGRTLLEHALGAVAGAAEVVVVGPETSTSRQVTFTRESPPGGGPLAGVAAGVAALRGEHERVVLLAVDMPHVDSVTVARLLAAADEADASWLTDEAGRRQLAGVVRPSLVPVPGDAAGAPMRQLMGAGDSRDVQAVGAEAEDVDSWADLARLRANPRFHPLPDLKERPRIDQIGPVNLHDWIDELCDVLDIDTEVDEALILDLAKVAATNVVRPAAPITTYLLGYAAGSVSADEDEVEDLAARAQALAEGWDRPSGAPDPDDVDDVVPDDTGVDHSDDTYDE